MAGCWNLFAQVKNPFTIWHWIFPRKMKSKIKRELYKCLKINFPDQFLLTLLINILLSAIHSLPATAGAMTMNKATIKKPTAKQTTTTTSNKGFCTKPFHKLKNNLRVFHEFSPTVVCFFNFSLFLDYLFIV